MGSPTEKKIEGDNVLSPVQRVKKRVKAYLADPNSDPAVRNLLTDQQTIIDSQEALFTSMQTNMLGLMRREVEPLRIRVEHLESTQRINLGIAIVCGVLLGGAIMHYAGKLSR
jgi:hypothetical protein